MTRPTTKQFLASRSTARQQGITLIELMISLLISSLLIGLVFAIYTRMSLSYRSQSGVSEVQQTLQAAKAEFTRHIRAAGHLIPQGFSTSVNVQTTLGAASRTIPPIEIINDNDGPTVDSFAADKIRVYYADASAIALITADPIAPLTTINVDDPKDFEADDLIVVVLNTGTASNALYPDGGAAPVVEYTACLFTINNIVGNSIDISDEGYYNANPTTDCDAGGTSIVKQNSMVYRFVGRSYRIDPDIANRELALWQVSRSGETMNVDDWETLGVGFTDFQVARRYWMQTPEGDRDNDGDPDYDWFSSTGQPGNGHLVELSVSLAVRTTANFDVVPTSATPQFAVTGFVNNNRLGDSPSVDLTLTGPYDAARPLHLQGNHIYRWLSVRIDLRNMGIGFGKR